MDGLPQELIERISSFLERSELKHTLAVNRQFQSAAERLSGAFEQFYLDFEEDNPKKAAQRFLRKFCGRHFRHLRDAFVSTTLSPPQSSGSWQYAGGIIIPDNLPCHESYDELRSQDREFERQIRFVFSMLKALEYRVGEGYGPGRIRLTIGAPRMRLDRMEVCLHRVYCSSRLHIFSHRDLPELRSIRHLLMANAQLLSPVTDHDFSFRLLDLRILIDLGRKLPNLDSLSCKIGGNEWPLPAKVLVDNNSMCMYQGPTRDSRHDFSKVLDDGRPLKYLRNLHFNFIELFSSADGLGQRRKVPNLIAPLTSDPFSAALRQLSYQLRHMYLTAVVDKTLFWPSDNSVPYWPNLESINARFHITCPSGEWYFNGLQGEGGEEGYKLDGSSHPPYIKDDGDCSEDELDWSAGTRAQFRVVPNQDNLAPFLSAFAKAKGSMPLLKQAALWSPLRFDVGNMGGFYATINPRDFMPGDDDEELMEIAWGIAYTKPGEKAFSTSPREDHSHSRQIWYKTGKWRPSPELQQAMYSIGAQRHGTDCIEYWDDDNFGNGLTPRWDSKIVREICCPMILCTISTLSNLSANYRRRGRLYGRFKLVFGRVT